LVPTVSARSRGGMATDSGLTALATTGEPSGGAPRD
jgi:hypothetical protein